MFFSLATKLPLLISKNLAEIKSIKVSNKNPDRLVLGADSVVSLNNELINKPKSREEAFSILKKLNNKDTIYTNYFFLKIIDFKTNTLIKFKNLREFSRELY